MYGLEQLYVREKSGAQAVYQGLMLAKTAKQRAQEWNEAGYCTARVRLTNGERRFHFWGIERIVTSPARLLIAPT